MFGDIIFRLLKIKEITQHQVRPVFYNQITNLIYEIAIKLENTKCKNCKYWKRYENDKYGKCLNSIINNDYLDTEGSCDELNYYDCVCVFEPDEDFCCSKFKSK